MTNQILLDATSYHVNDLNFHKFGDFGELVNPFHVPSKMVADTFVKAYISTIHPFYPIILGPIFLSQYETFWQTSQAPPDAPLWLSILNLVFALGALHTQSVDPQWNENNEGDHVLYYVRAKLLAPEPLATLDLPTVERIQVASLNGMYLISTCQFNR